MQLSEPTCTHLWLANCIASLFTLTSAAHSAHSHSTHSLTLTITKKMFRNIRRKKGDNRKEKEIKGVTFHGQKKREGTGNKKGLPCKMKGGELRKEETKERNKKELIWDGDTRERKSHAWSLKRKEIQRKEGRHLAEALPKTPHYCTLVFSLGTEPCKLLSLLLFISSLKTEWPFKLHSHTSYLHFLFFTIFKYYSSM